MRIIRALANLERGDGAARDFGLQLIHRHDEVRIDIRAKPICPHIYVIGGIGGISGREIGCAAGPDIGSPGHDLAAFTDIASA